MQNLSQSQAEGDVDVDLSNMRSIIIYPFDECNFACKFCDIKKPLKASKAFNANIEDFRYHISEEHLERINSLDPKSVGIIGGEPLLSPAMPDYLNKLVFKDMDAEQIKRKKELEKVGILDSAVTVFTNASLIDDDVIEFFKTFGKNISVTVSIEGDKEYTDSVRGDGVEWGSWGKCKSSKCKSVYDHAIESVAKLLENGIHTLVRMGYCMDNLNSVLSVTKQLEGKVPVELAPRLDQKYDFSGGKSVLDRSTMFQLYEIASTMSMVDILQPSFKNFLGFSSSCPAGWGRFGLRPDGSIIPCHWGSEVVANIENRDEFIEEQLRSWLGRNRRAKTNYCYGCKYLQTCKSSCMMSMDYTQCPVKQTGGMLEGREVRVGNEIRTTSKSFVKANFGDVDLAGCEGAWSLSGC